ncbi:universal stress protein [Halorubrum sp. JWXQ-INN 858]|uniref:universal stress protein n=1 Tax=Halorubrum sp. JWXQ-INN 858 TaxID=2690782 RepID=UPI001356D02C|nr:universal stress protein [Halorubrum sp. JWXQ-INN 858]MWV66088.1 universal stress protein [Halorubrum sp. JWXQ-INN 858]
MYDRILCPTDGSDGAAAALDHAIELASRYDASLHLLYVVDEYLPALDAGDPELAGQLRAAGERIVTAARERAIDAGVREVRGEVVGGTPHRRILSAADAEDVDLVVMGTHGRTGLDRYLLGSVAERVVRLADVPVLTVRRPTADWDR